jgi:predicted nucleic acid-binding Zn ribbon protein
MKNWSPERKMRCTKTRGRVGDTSSEQTATEYASSKNRRRRRRFKILFCQFFLVSHDPVIRL